jgi:hypothetical protein
VADRHHRRAFAVVAGARADARATAEQGVPLAGREPAEASRSAASSNGTDAHNQWKAIGTLASTFQLRSARWEAALCINEDDPNVYGNAKHLRLRPCVMAYPNMYEQEMFLDDY